MKKLNNMLQLVKSMHCKFGINHELIKFSDEEKEFRVKCMTEEISEYFSTKTKEDELDALVDLVVFALGTAERQGYLPVFEEAFRRVMEMNMLKEIGPNQKRGSFSLDLVKPHGWKPASLIDLVTEADKPVDGQMSLLEYKETHNVK